MPDILNDLRALVMKAGDQRAAVLASLRAVGIGADKAAVSVARDDLDAAEASLAALRLVMGVATKALGELRATIERERVLHNHVIDVALAAANDKADDDQEGEG